MARRLLVLAVDISSEASWIASNSSAFGSLLSSYSSPHYFKAISNSVVSIESTSEEFSPKGTSSTAPTAVFRALMLTTHTYIAHVLLHTYPESTPTWSTRLALGNPQRHLAPHFQQQPSELLWRFPRFSGSGARPRPQQLGLLVMFPPASWWSGAFASHMRPMGFLQSTSKWTGFSLCYQCPSV
jgi:hypothetical protein